MTDVWRPTPEDIAHANITATCRSLGLDGYDAFYRWSITEREAFWTDIISRIGVVYRTAPERVLDLTDGVTRPNWLVGARMNIADSCFTGDPSETAIVYQRPGGPLQHMTLGDLDTLSDRVAASLATLGVKRGDAVAIAMTMTVEAVAAYLGVVKAGCAVVSIADSFAPDEIATRLRIANARAVVTQDVVYRGEKTFPMYAKVVEAGTEVAVVVRAGDTLAVALLASDVEWSEFVGRAGAFESVACDPSETTNILFSSGTTGDPKAIPWTHTTPIKSAMDGYYHHDIHRKDVVAWPTNIGWMMGPWLIYASLMNRATMALYYGPPNTEGFCRFVEDARVSMLGVVPSLVRAWRGNDMTADKRFARVRCFSSTGEASNADDMWWLMEQAGGRPVVEYCGGTEIGGGYITQTLVQPAIPATFSTPALGLGVVIVGDDGTPCDSGEMFLTPPSMGLSVSLLNRDHDEVYYRGTPQGPDGELLRRHGDEMERLPNGHFRAHGRADDTMNLGGIKVSSAEIERAVAGIDGVLETAAIAHDPPGGGPSRLVIFAVPEPNAALDPGNLRARMQKKIAAHLNPLFRVHDVVPVDSLPRTASNKVMRRVLRGRYAG